MEMNKKPDEMKLIHAHVFNPMEPNFLFKPKKTEPASYHTVSCTQSHRCELFARGQCVARNPFAGGCMYGRASTVQGPTHRARGFYDWIRTHKEMASKVGHLDAPSGRLAKVGDYIYLPYAHMGAAIKGDGNIGNILQMSQGSFLPFEQFTSDMIGRICSARPQALMGGTIAAYQAESVPKFVAHLSETYPELLAEAAKTSLHVQRIVASLTKVGRKARLRTLRPNVGTFEGGWKWDGVFMSSDEKASFSAFTKFNAVHMRIIPGDAAVVVVTDNAQVTPETEFID